MSMNTYDDFSQDYDRFVNWPSRLNAEMPFLEHLLGQVKTNHDQPLSVLDAACGTGMHAIELARRGYRVAGADFSRRMVEVARKNAKAAEQEIVFKTAGFKELRSAFGGEPLFPFDAITCFGNSLPHLLSRDEIMEALVDFSDCLRPGGMLVLQNRNFDAVMKKRERWIGPQSHKEDDGEWLFLRFYDFDPDGLITFNIVRLKKEENEPWSQVISTVRLYPLLRDELLDLLEKTGFTGIQTFGRMENQAFDPSSSENLVISAIKK